MSRWDKKASTVPASDSGHEDWSDVLTDSAWPLRCLNGLLTVATVATGTTLACGRSGGWGWSLASIRSALRASAYPLLGRDVP